MESFIVAYHMYIVLFAGGFGITTVVTFFCVINPDPDQPELTRRNVNLLILYAIITGLLSLAAW